MPAYSLMCGLDLMSYRDDQYFIIPYLVYSKALHMVSTYRSPVNLRILHLVECTCMVILLENDRVLENLVEKVINFAFQDGEIKAEGGRIRSKIDKEPESTRTPKQVKSIEVLCSQLYCLFKIPQWHLRIPTGYRQMFNYS